MVKTPWVIGYLRYQLVQILCLSTINPASSHKFKQTCCSKISERFFVQKKNGKKISQNLWPKPFSKTSSSYKLMGTTLTAAHLTGPIRLPESPYAGNTGLDGEIMDDVSVLPKEDSQICRKNWRWQWTLEFWSLLSKCGLFRSISKRSVWLESAIHLSPLIHPDFSKILRV